LPVAALDLPTLATHTLKPLELALAFLVQTMAHAKKREGMEGLVQATSLGLARHAPTAQWLLAKYVVLSFCPSHA
jgi:hypothetical protein